ncbi:hypothetical protein [Limnohabitans sp. Jir72]|uniref:hypothetical protein n=1 Tax=Limnohabitans sp. Jir72 TaxID=1977909 RepID=UPI000D39C319|nr:hypothetical protein [Limnohabitans sp. Jir72]PUE36043.1 hypothetical protein B9Z52_02525 [Limnohabitans sp. Jir72]
MKFSSHKQGHTALYARPELKSVKQKRGFAGRIFRSDVALVDHQHVGAEAADLQGKIHTDCGGAQGLPRVLRARWIPTIKTWMLMGKLSTAAFEFACIWVIGPVLKYEHIGQGHTDPSCRQRTAVPSPMPIAVPVMRFVFWGNRMAIS